MDLFSSLNADRVDKALDRLAGMIELYQSDSHAEQILALDRAQAYCQMEWGGYAQGLGALAARILSQGGDISQAEQLEAEASDPGFIISRHREGRDEASKPLPSTIQDARSEAVSWEQRRLAGQMLTPRQEQRLEEAIALWSHAIPASSSEDYTARLQFWSERGGNDGTGYAILAADFAHLFALPGWARMPGISTREKARRLKAENPDWSLARIGKHLGISRQAVHKHLKGFIPPV